MGIAINVARARSRLVGLFLALSLLALTWILAGKGTSAGWPPSPDLSVYPWLYLRDGKQPAAGEPLVEIIAVGDVMPGRGIAGVREPLAQAAPWLRAADLTMGNLEAVLAPEDEPRPDAANGAEPIILAAPSAATNWLREAGFDLLSLANNHSLDYGSAGLTGTLARLEAAGITPLGAGASEAAYDPHIREVRGVRLAFLAFNAVPDPAGAAAQGGPGEPQPAAWEEARALQAVQAARREADAVVVSIHWGHEYEPRAAPWQQEAARALLAAGADLVIGHHPHVVQEVAMAGPGQNAMVAYSLGNFLFDQGGPETGQGLALRAFFDAAGLRAVQAVPVRAGPHPRLMSPDEAEPLLSRLQPAPQRLAFACTAETCAPLNAPVPEEPQGGGRFWSGAIDLTGDGVPEVVRRAAHGVTVYEGGRAAWQSPAEWRVVDVALGDPDDDGRSELLLALGRRDADGYERSQPYILGHRGGEYKVLWGGRPVAFPILEVELGDVDGDGSQELVVLEEVGDQARLAVWRWQEWSFSLVWRSQPDRFRDLQLRPGVDDALLVTAVCRQGCLHSEIPALGRTGSGPTLTRLP